MNDVANAGYCWSSSTTGSHSYYLAFGYSGYVNPSNYDYRSYGFSLRCVQE